MKPAQTPVIAQMRLSSPMEWKIPLEDGTVDAVLVGQAWLQVANGAI